MNIIEPILYQCKLNPLTLAIHVPGMKFGSVTYGVLEKHIYSVAGIALKTGVTPGEVVATYIGDTVLNTVVTLGLMHAGAITLALRDPSLVPGITPVAILTDQQSRTRADATVVTVDQSWLEGDAAGRDPARVEADDICRIILTSGSTGVSKGVALSHRAMGGRTWAYSTLRGPRFAHCPRFFCDLGIGTSPGIHYALSVLGRGATIYFLGPEPSDILQTINLHQIQGMGTSPYGLGEFLKFFESDSAFQMNFDHIICQGAALSRELSRRARARLCQNLYSSFGATETSTVAFGPASVIEQTPGAVGYVQPSAVVEAVDSAGKVLPTLQDGSLRIRSRYMASGYLGDPETTGKLFRDGYFYSGDVGHLRPDGMLVVSGREKTALNIGGATINPEQVEEVIESFPEIREAGVFAENNNLGISELYALLVARSPINEEALRVHCAKRLPSSCVPVRFFIVEALPRGAQGKLERHGLRALAAVERSAN